VLPEVGNMLVHKHLIVRAEVEHAPTERSWTERWLKQLVEKIGMKVCAGPISQYVDMPGNRGMTAVVIIETSHIAVHFWDEPSPNLMQFDVYTCGPINPQDVLEELETFGVQKVEYKFLDREHGLKEIPL
jgi:S-adenosylmethionine/arginine decarboxylase-like enzyme